MFHNLVVYIYNKQQEHLNYLRDFSILKPISSKVPCKAPVTTAAAAAVWYSRGSTFW